MNEFVIKEVVGADMIEELESIGFDKSYVHAAAKKFYFKTIKIYNLTSAQANILKQLALSVGADCGTHREVITGKIDNSDCLLGGSLSQLHKIAEKLRHQPFKLSQLAQTIESILALPKKNQVKIVGILNLTPDSFSDGGEFLEYSKACEHLISMVNDGADVIDIGAESTKPFSHPISAEKQLEKLLPILEFVQKEKIQTPVSIDTRDANVAEKCIQAGAKMINDVSGFDYDSNMPEVISKGNVDIVLQHCVGTPENMQVSPNYTNLMDEIYLSLKKKRDLAIQKGIMPERIILDAGIGFGKTLENNFEILKRINELKTLNSPIMLGISRKSLLQIPDKNNELKDIYTLALNTLAIEHGVEYVRVHNVKLHRDLLMMLANGGFWS